MIRNRRPGSGTPETQSFFDFLGNVIRPATGAIYQGLQRAYPENRRNPKVGRVRAGGSRETGKKG